MMEKQERNSRKTVLKPVRPLGRKIPAAAVPLTSQMMVHIQAGPVSLDGNLQIPEEARALVLFLHGSGSSRYSPRNEQVARSMHAAGMATLLFDLLTPEEEEMDRRTRHLRYDIGLLARRVIGTVDWLKQQQQTSGFLLGFFGASTGAAAALIAAAERPETTAALVLRDGRPDLAIAALPRLKAPVLLIAGELDETLCAVNDLALGLLDPQLAKELQIVPGAGMLLEEPGTAAEVERLAIDWFKKHLGRPFKGANKG